jgi:rSAM/selenodomain-associated transferase 1
MKNTDALVILAKVPDSGTVKTRLKGQMTDRERVGLYTSLLEGTVLKLGRIPGVDSYISYSPAGSREYFSSFGLPMFPQLEGDLGERMYRALKTVLANGHERAALVGVDIPDITADTVLEALGLLAESDMVFGPAEDGGYYLVALKTPIEEIFRGIRWSTPETLRQSLQRAEEHGYRVALADTLHDIDTIEDVKAYGRGLGHG